MIDAAGQPAGFASNCAAVHAFCSVVSREGSCLGSSTLTLAMFACAYGALGVGQLHVQARAVRFAGLPRRGDREFRRERQGRAVGDLERHATAPRFAPSVLVEAPGDRQRVQLVGLNVNPGRLIVTLTCLICSGIPSRIVRDRVRAAVVGRDRQRGGVRVDFDLRAHDRLCPRSNGPAFAGLTIDRPNGAPS